MRKALPFVVPVSLCLLLLTSLSCREKAGQEASMGVRQEPLAGVETNPPKSPLNILFIHHSCGGHLMADKGPKGGQDSIYVSHPNGGGLRKLLEANNYVVHEASYGSKVGEDTDICHWNAKFRDQMDAILATKRQDERLEEGARNRIVMFKSCFPNSWLDSDGTEPGNPDSCEHTTANYKAAYRALLPYFAEHPDTMFVVLTAPPLAPPGRTTIKEMIKKIFGREDIPSKAGPRIRAFNNWLKDSDNGWLKDYPGNNVVVFDMYDVLTRHGASDWSAYPTEGGGDSHPSSEGNRQVAIEFVPFLNASVENMGLSGR